MNECLGRESSFPAPPTVSSMSHFHLLLTDVALLSVFISTMEEIGIFSNSIHQSSSQSSLVRSFIHSSNSLLRSDSLLRPRLLA